jgi:hypothetical protein
LRSIIESHSNHFVLWKDPTPSKQKYRLSFHNK